jgi:hypothetical protein
MAGLIKPAELTTIAANGVRWQNLMRIEPDWLTGSRILLASIWSAVVFVGWVQLSYLLADG